FAWFVESLGGDHALLSEQAARLTPGESGLLALDWWNGNRSILVDVDLTGLLVGATLQTQRHEIYRALIEATAFGTNLIVRNFRDHGVPIDELYACGGLPERNPLLMQIYADVCDMPIRISASAETPALGSAMFAAVAAGAYSDIGQAAKRMAHLKSDVYRPNPEAQAVYEQLYNEYVRLHDYFGRGDKPVMVR